MGVVDPRLIARWKARVEFLLSVVELLFLSLTVEALQSKMCQNSLPSGLIPLERQLIALQLCR